MGKQSPHNERSNERTKAIGLSIGASIIAAVATMFVPTAMLEAITGATGLSELVHATAAPLGDKARALIAFGAGAVTMAVALGFLLRKNNASENESDTMATADKVSSNDNIPLFSQIRQRIGSWKAPKMPWARSEASNDVYELSDLPKLRSQDAHPDTPRRRPISAASDFGDIGLDGKQVYMPDVPMPSQGGSTPFSAGAFAGEEAAQQNAVSHDDMPFYADRDIEFTPADNEATVEFAAPNVAEPAPAPAAPAAVSAAIETDKVDVQAQTGQIQTGHIQTGTQQPSLAELVEQFEAAVENRKAQLKALEMIAEQMAAKAQAAPQAEQAAAQADHAAVVTPPQPAVQRSEIEIMPPAPRPPLEAVPASPRQQNDDEMDAALNAALATLQRMNAK
jgi:hypothetical protein